MIKAVIFDCFGVLAGSSYREIYRSAGGDLEKDKDFLDNILATANAGFMTAEELGQKVSERLGITPAAWAEKLRIGDLPNEELLSYVAELRERGYKTAILSNTTTGALQRNFSREQLSLFDELIVSADLHIIKPDPRIFQLAAERLGQEPEDCVFADDNTNNTAAAAALGMKAFHYEDLDTFKKQLENVFSSESE